MGACAFIYADNITGEKVPGSRTGHGKYKVSNCMVPPTDPYAYSGASIQCSK